MTDETAARRPRVALLDVARGVALVAMASYHFTWDLEHFGYAAPGLTAIGGWKIYARCIASTFLFLAGVSLVLAHGRGIGWRGFWRRWGGIAAGAVAISFVTYLSDPDEFIFFGILHEIALASLVGLLFLRVPALLTGGIAALIVVAPMFARSPIFDHWPLWWVGLSTEPLRSNDYVPVFPWLAPLLFGLAAARLAESFGVFDRLAQARPGAWSRPLTFIGRHSLVFYLVHQPILFGCVWLASQLMPPSPERLYLPYRQACEINCGSQKFGEEFCARYCVCLLDRLESEGNLKQSYPATDADRSHLDDIKGSCAADANGPETGEDKR